MKIQQKKTARYIYDPQLIDPRLDFYPRSAFDFNQEPWVAPLCTLARYNANSNNAFWEDTLFGIY